MANDLVKRLRNVQFWQAECDMRMQAAARIDNLEQVLRDMVDLFSADDMLLKGTHLHATLKLARAALKGTNK